MIETIFTVLVVVIIGINIATTVSTKFRRWLYKDKNERRN
jgi:hypothetical protein